MFLIPSSADSCFKPHPLLHPHSPLPWLAMILKQLKSGHLLRHPLASQGKAHTFATSAPQRRQVQFPQLPPPHAVFRGSTEPTSFRCFEDDESGCHLHTHLQTQTPGTWAGSSQAYPQPLKRCFTLQHPTWSLPQHPSTLSYPLEPHL